MAAQTETDDETRWHFTLLEAECNALLDATTLAKDALLDARHVNADHSELDSRRNLIESAQVKLREEMRQQRGQEA